MALHMPLSDGQSRLSRRAVLSLAGAGLAATAGCSQFTAGDDADADDMPGPDPADAISGVDVRTFRFDTTRSVVEVDGEPGPPGRRYLISESDVAELTFTEDPLGDEDPLEFLESIDYSETTCLLLSDQVDACYRQRLQYVEQRSGGGLRVRFCRTYRDPDVECSTGDQQTQLTLIAVPINFDSQPSGFGRGSSSRCRVEPDHPDWGRADE